jgi:hypothetical protein
MGEDFTLLIIFITIVLHIPAIVLAIIGAVLLKSKPTTAKTLFIIAGVYTIIGLGICGSILHH